LRCEEDVDDAVQATLLVLARKAGSIRKRTALGSWLHGVAYRISLNASKMALRRQAYEKHGRSPLPPGPVSEAALHELQAMLDEEVEHLPEKLRAPFVLCCLEGMSKSDAARELGWKEGTVSGRVAQARERLRRRLAQRGVMLSAVLCATAISSSTAFAVSAALLDNVLACAAGRTSKVSAEATSLAERMVACLYVTRSATRLIALLAICVLACGIGLILANQEDGTQVHALVVAPPAGWQTALANKGQPTSHQDHELPQGAVARLGSTRLRHAGQVFSVAFSPDGKTN